MQRKRAWLGAVVVGIVAGLAFSSFGGAAVRHVSQLIAPTSKSAVADVNAFNNWDPSTYSRDGFSKVSHFDTGIYCLSGRANPDKSMLLVTMDQQHSNAPGFIMWDRSTPDCGPGFYEVLTYCMGEQIIPGPRQPAPDTLCDDIAFYAEAFVRS